MSIFYLSKEQAARHEELRPLIALDSTRIEDYEAPFRAFLASGLLERLVREALDGLDSARERLETTCEDNDWRLVLTERFSLIARLTTSEGPQADLATRTLDGGGRRLVSLPNDVLIGVIGSGTIDVDLYRSAFPRDKHVFSREHRIEPLGRRTLGSGDVCLLHACDDVFELRGASGDVVLAELALTSANSIVWNYDPETLAASFASSASVDATRTEFAIELFKLFKDRATLPTLRRIARDHTHHWVRWKAVKAMLSIDPAFGVDLLPTFLEDPHPHVRNAARRTLENLRRATLAG